MSQWKAICCPTDFSEESRAALRAAADLAKRFGSELTLLHVEQNAQKQASPHPHDSHLEAWKREAQALGATAIRLAEVSGDPQVAIADFAQQGHFDLIVMGTHGRTGRDRSLIGSVAEYTVRRSRVPVLTVHAGWPERP